MTDMTPGTAKLLKVMNLSKCFGGLEVLRHVSIAVERGEVLGIIGPNGAGKTTLFNCILGVISADAGAVILEGKRIDSLPVWKRADMGMARTFQRLELFSGMTPREHLLVADRVHRHSGSIFKDLRGHGVPAREELDRVSDVLELFDLAEVADTPAEALSLGHGRLVELARAFILEPILLMLDEPSSGLDASETELIITMLERLQGNGRTATVIVEHDLQMVRRVASRLAVLNSGELIADGDVGTVLADSQVRQVYLGST
ncbi:MAG: ATP-binding cassette domain-containing protein [Actinobacteria bacterium]|nr:ATP-binding cassette domain-containing protein [Actinomycetota bacterium]